MRETWLAWKSSCRKGFLKHSKFYAIIRSETYWPNYLFHKIIFNKRAVVWSTNIFYTYLCIHVTANEKHILITRFLKVHTHTHIHTHTHTHTHTTKVFQINKHPKLLSSYDEYFDPIQTSIKHLSVFLRQLPVLSSQSFRIFFQENRPTE